jgi:hypothetical protein
MNQPVHKEDHPEEEDEVLNSPRSWNEEMKIRRDTITIRELAGLPWEPRLIPDSDLDSTYVLQIHQQSEKNVLARI